MSSDLRIANSILQQHFSIHFVNLHTLKYHELLSCGWDKKSRGWDKEIPHGFVPMGLWRKCKCNKTVRNRGRSTRPAWPLTVANCVSVHITCHQLVCGLPRATKRLKNDIDGDSRHEHSSRSLERHGILICKHKTFFFFFFLLLVRNSKNFWHVSDKFGKCVMWRARAKIAKTVCTATFPGFRTNGYRFDTNYTLMYADVLTC